VLGAAVIAAIYHLALFIQQRNKFLLYYSLYLFSLASYIAFKLFSNNYDPFEPTDNVWYYVLEELLQVMMVSVYVLFAAQTLEVMHSKNIVRNLMWAFFILSALSITYHIAGAIVNGAGVKSREMYAIFRTSLVGIATIALILVWRIRTTTFQRTIIIGSLVTDFSGLLSIISFVQQTDIMGLTGVEPYLVGCMLDIIIFSSALGFRLKTIADQKNELLKKESEARLAIEKTRTSIALNLHDDIGSVLSSMSIYSEAAKKSLLDNNPERAAALIEQIGENARETMSSMSDIVWTINPINDNGIRLCNRMEAFATSILSSLHIELEFKVEDSLREVDFLMPVRQNLYLLFKEVMNNCAKHSKASKVNVDFVVRNGMLAMTVRDNGQGIDVMYNGQGNGLRNVNLRAQDLGGTLRIEPLKPGTLAVLEFPFQDDLEREFGPKIR